MPNPLLPPIIPNRTAAAICGRSLASYMAHVWPSVAAYPRGTDLALLEQHLGVAIEPLSYLSAQRRTDHLRQREAADKRRA